MYYVRAGNFLQLCDRRTPEVHSFHGCIMDVLMTHSDYSLNSCLSADMFKGNLRRCTLNDGFCEKMKAVAKVLATDMSIRWQHDDGLQENFSTWLECKRHISALPLVQNNLEREKERPGNGSVPTIATVGTAQTSEVRTIYGSKVRLMSTKTRKMLIWETRIIKTSQ